MEKISGTATVCNDGHGHDSHPGHHIPKRKKVLIIAPFHRGIGGAETYLFSLMEEACKRYDVFLASLAKPPQVWQGTPISKVFGICRELLHEALKYRTREIETIDCHGLQAALVGYLMSWHFKLKFCVTMLALYDFRGRSWLFRFICRTILNRADVVFVEGQTGKRDLLECGVKEEKIKPFLHWVDTNVYKPKPRKHKGLKVLFVGRPIPIKGKHIVEDIEKKLFFLKDLTFTYIENVPHKELTKYYQEADVLIVPSQYPEGFPRVVFEAAACGCAIVTSDRGALPELVKNFGLVTKDFIKAVYKIYENEWRGNSRLYAEKFFTLKNAETILKEY